MKTILPLVVLAAAIILAAPTGGLSLGLASFLGVSTAVASALIFTAVTVIGNLLINVAYKALAVGAPKASDQVGPPQVFRQSITDSFIVYGKRRVGGLLAFFHAKQSGSDHYRYFVIACAGHRCQGAVSWLLGDETVTVDGSNMVTSGKYAGGAWLWFQRGLASETANATFVAECDGNWTTAHKGNGVAAIYAKFKLTDAVVQAGMPNVTAVIEGRDEIRDSRTGTTGYTRNSALIFYDWMAMLREEGGFGAYADEIPDDTWISAQANVCDETVNTNPRYACDAVITTGAAPGDVRDAMIVNCAGSYTYSNGKHLMRPGYWNPVSATLGESDLAGPIKVTPFMTSDAAATQIQGSYISPADGYQGMPFTTWTRPAATDIRQLDLDLAFTTVKDQADRVAAIMGKRAACEKQVVWPMNIVGVKVRALDTVQLASTRYGLDNYAWVVANWGLSADWGVVLSLREENSEIYDDGAATGSSTPPAIQQPSGPLVLATPAIVGPGSGNVLYDNTGVTFQSADDLNYKVQGSSGTITSGVTMSYKVKSGTFNGFTSASGAQTMTVTSGAATITPTALTTATGQIEITAVYNGLSLPAFTTTLTRTFAAATPAGTGGGGGGSTDVASQSSGYTLINTATFTTITSSLMFTLPTGKTTLRAVVNLSCKYPNTANQSGPWHVEFKVQRGGVDQGSTQGSNPDPDITTDGSLKYSEPGTMQYTLDMAGLTSGTQYSVAVQARVASGTLPTNAVNMNFTGAVTLSAP